MAVAVAVGAGPQGDGRPEAPLPRQEVRPVDIAVLVGVAVGGCDILIPGCEHAGHREHVQVAVLIHIGCTDRRRRAEVNDSARCKDAASIGEQPDAQVLGGDDVNVAVAVHVGDIERGGEVRRRDNQMFDVKAAVISLILSHGARSGKTSDNIKISVAIHVGRLDKLLHAGPIRVNGMTCKVWARAAKVLVPRKSFIASSNDV